MLSQPPPKSSDPLTASSTASLGEWIPVTPNHSRTSLRAGIRLEVWESFPSIDKPQAAWICCGCLGDALTPIFRVEALRSSDEAKQVAVAETALYYIACLTEALGVSADSTERRAKIRAQLLELAAGLE